MPRFKASDWSGTWSPQDEVKEIPSEIAAFLACPHVTKAFAVIEADEDHKGHLHFGFRLRKAYDSDYNWWGPLFKEKNEVFQKPALLIKATKTLHGLIGGYCSKAEGTRVVFRRGFTDEEMDFGRREYQNGLDRQAIRQFSERFQCVHPARYDVVLGATRQQFGLTSDEAAVERMCRIGFAFSNANKADTSKVYQTLFKEWMDLSHVPGEN